MRELIIKKRAENAIYKVAQFVASKNFPSSGGKFINEVFDFCIDYSLLNLKHPLCKNSVLAKHGYSCTVYKKKWVGCLNVLISSLLFTGLYMWLC